LHRSLKRKLVIGLAALSVAAFAGGAYAATQSSTPNTRQAFLDDVAKRLHVTPQQLTQALQGATTDQLQAAVKAGRLTQAQANQLEQRLKQNGNAPGVPFGFFGGPGPGPRPGPGFSFPGGPGRAFGFGRGIGAPAEIQTAASYLGLTSAQLFQQLSSGKSLAQIATAQHKTASGLEQAITTAVKTRLDKLVANKMLTAAQEQKILGHMSTRLAQMINQRGLLTFKFKRPGLRFPGGKLPAPPTAPNTPVPPAYVPAPQPAPVA
jgi:AraC-like DNA-binding protein